MRHRPLGNTGIEVSEIAFGGVEIGIPYGIGIEHESQLLAECDAIALLRQALDGGINLFGTARHSSVIGTRTLVWAKKMQ